MTLDALPPRSLRTLPLAPLLVALLFSAAPVSMGQEPPSAPGPQALPSDPAGGSAAEEKPRRSITLTVDECVELAIRQNHGLAADWLARRIADAGIEEARGAFDPIFGTTASWAEDRVPIGSALGGASVLEDSVITWDSSLGGLLPTGLTYDVTWNVVNTDNNNSFQLFNPQTRNSLTVNVTQPLLRGAWTTVNEQQIRSAEIAKSTSDEDFNAALSTLIHGVRSAYWDLSFARRNVQLRKANLELGQESVRITRRRYAEGLVPASDILTATAEVYRREEALISAQNVLYNAEDALKRLIFAFANRPEWDFEIVSGTAPREPGGIPTPALESALADAFRDRADLRSQRLSLRQRELDLFVARNGLQPQLDLVGSWRSQALGTELSDTWEDTLTGEEQSYSVGLQLSVPIGNTAARARLRRAELQIRQSVELLRELENQIATEVRTAVRDLHYLQRKWEAAVQTRRNTEEDHRAQRVKLDLGLITQFDLQTVEQNLVQSRTSEVEAQTDHERALSNFERVIGRSYREGWIQGLVAASRLGRNAAL
ncbi:MAG: TolC family protein [Planctomycetes bacterium]|nr:TolC family protein [Planctomycetota bacterium]